MCRISGIEVNGLGVAKFAIMHERFDTHGALLI